MANRVSTGAYIIRNRSTSYVLHSEFSHKDSKVLAFQQDENQYRDQQIWWIELLPSDDADEKDAIYSITLAASGRSLDFTGGGGLCAAKTHGGTWQTWKLQRVGTSNDRPSYIIISNFSGEGIGCKDPGAMCRTKKYIPDDDQQWWEFVTPIVSFPIGWFHIQNVRTGDLLSHKYLFNPPILLPNSVSTQPSQHLESWATQWTLAQVKTIKPGHQCTTGQNSWYIINRLTRGLLSNTTLNDSSTRVVAWGDDWGNVQDRLWKLELDPACNWTIIHHHTSLLLEQTTVPRGGGTEVACIHKWLNLETSNLSGSWAFTSPLLEKTEEVRAYLERCSRSQKMPPAYGA